jgi:hypothetical protein
VRRVMIQSVTMSVFKTVRECTVLTLAAPVLFQGLLTASSLPGPVTVLYDDRSIVLDHVGTDPAHSPDALWVRKIDLPRINGFELKPQGACRGDVCVPVPKEQMTRSGFFDLTAFARKVGQSVVVDRTARVWSFGEIPAFGSGSVGSRIAPDFTVPDRKGQPVHLSDFRGKKVLVVTWASW